MKNNDLKHWIRGKYFYSVSKKVFEKIWNDNKDIYDYICSKKYKKLLKSAK